MFNYVILLATLNYDPQVDLAFNRNQLTNLPPLYVDYLRAGTS